nr:hypothetical protein BaRGS_000391 [Batillaria attramentaria]
MEDLRGYTLYRKWLLAGNVDEDVARILARNIATIHSETHVTNIGQEALQQLDKEFQNPELMKLLDSVIYVDPMIREKAVKHISPALKKQAEAVFADAELLKAMGDIRRVFLEKKEAFIHSDTHSSSVMVKGKDVRLFDLECARVGPCAKDLGQVLANYFFCYFHHLHHPDNNNQTHTWMVDTLPDICRATVEEYLNHLNVIVDDKDSFIRQLMSETAGFAAAQIFSRLLSIARVEDMDSMESAQPDALAAGCRLLKAQHSVHDVAAMMDLVLRHTS